MTIIEYAKKLNIQLNSMQLELLDLWEKNRDISAVIMLPRMSGRQMIYDLITRYEGYRQGRQDEIEEIYSEFEKFVKSQTKTSYYWTELWCEFMRICKKAKEGAK